MLELDASTLSKHRSKMQSFARLGLTPDDGQMTQMQGLVEEVKDFFDRQLADFLQTHADRPVLAVYQGDPTPVKLSMRHRIGSAPSSGKPQFRHGSAGHEFLVQAAFWSTLDVFGHIRSVVKLRDPIPLSAGKKTFNLFTAANEFFPTLKVLKHSGISVHVYVFDRGLESSLGNALVARHRLTSEEQGFDVLDAALSGWTSWQISLGCSIHDVHNALKWAVCQGEADNDRTKALHIGNEALKNSFDLILARLPEFLQKHLVFSVELPSDEVTCWEHYWQACGLDTEEVEALSRLQLRWDPAAGVLRLSQERRLQEDLTAEISRIMLSVMRFRTFTLSRWATAGPSCRCLMAAWALGLSQLVAMCREDKHTSQYYIGGFSQLDHNARRFAASLGITSHLADALILMILEDDRLALHHEEVVSTLQEEVSYVKNLSVDTWQKVAELFDLGTSALCLRDTVLNAVHIFEAYVEQKVLSITNSTLWKMVRGDVGAHVDELASQVVAPAEPVLHAAWQLLRLGSGLQTAPPDVFRGIDTSHSRTGDLGGHGLPPSPSPCLVRRLSLRPSVGNGIPGSPAPFWKLISLGACTQPHWILSSQDPPN